jgi:hypothetical protein
MDLFKQVLDLVGYVSSAILIITGITLVYAWIRGLLVPIWRLGVGLSRRKIALFAKDGNKNSFEDLLTDSSLFKSKNIIPITKINDLGRCESATLFLVIWEDFGTKIKDILSKKHDKTALVVFAKTEEIKTKEWEELQTHRNVTVVNLRGRLIGDIIVSLMATGYEKE